MSLVVSPVTTARSRAVLRPVAPGSCAVCPGCATAVKFAARVRKHQVIANVYVGDRWDRVEHYHPECYGKAGDPHGPVIELPANERRR
ncbi:MAG: hypothetical protein KY450_09730 [Actinobacteria bacterium]|nr:hypothetical protein [Actinomycetota bacterium]